MAVLPLLAFAACGNDDDTAAGDGDGNGDDSSEFCAVAQELNESEEFPTEEQLERYKATAPAEIADDAAFVADAFIEAGVEGAGQLFADPEITERFERLETYEADECGLDVGGELPDGVSRELDEDAQRVDVSAVEYDFIFEPPTAGAVSFVMSNDGEEPHYLGLGKLREGATLEDAINADDPDEFAEWTADSDVVGPGGEAVLTVEDLEAGEYGMVCFIPGPDGTPHAFSGMAVPFTVAE